MTRKLPDTGKRFAPTLIGGTPAGSMRSFFRYQPTGATTASTALAVADAWCPRIQELAP